MLSNFALPRFFSTCRIVYAVEKASLSELRKKTGYSFSNCKKALELNENDMNKSLIWLKQQAQKEGWEKVAKLKGRSTSNGVISVHYSQKAASMVELKCETDFVARTPEFKSLAAKLAAICSNHISLRQASDPINKWSLQSEQINDITLADGQKVGDLIALTVNDLKENIILNRALCMKVNEEHNVSALTHPATKFEQEDESKNFVGQYGALLVYKANSEKPIQRVAQQICQHVVGLNPAKIGSLEEWQKDYDEKKAKLAAVPATEPEEIEAKEEPLEEESLEKKSLEEENELVDENEPEEEEKMEQAPNFDEEEERLLYQKFLLNPDISIGELVVDSGIELVEFTRYQFGEEITEPSLDNISRAE